VGNESSDDAAVYDIGGGKAVISTTDFFTPIVDDPYDFGRIAATNALSDVYAMGGNPLMAIAILGWPLDKLPAYVAGKVLEGARTVCTAAGIPLAGGHSISISEPVFGLAVTGLMDSALVKKNNTIQKGDLLFLTKPLGIGLISTGIKRGVASEEHMETALQLMTRLNAEGPRLALLSGVHALTDVTGFGLLGHCLEMVEGSGLTARIGVDNVPLIPGIDKYIALDCIPGGTHRNFASYGHRLAFSAEDNTVIVGIPEGSTLGGDPLQGATLPVAAPTTATAGIPEGSTPEGGTLGGGTLPDAAQKPAISGIPKGGTLPDPVKLRLCDPQTSGGLLIAAHPDTREVLEKEYGAVWVGEIV
jgi:selenide,water dikinase